MNDRLRRAGGLVPGVALAIAVAAAAVLLHAQLPAALGRGLGAVLFAVLLGLVVGNLAPLPASTASGVRFAARTVLQLAIVLLGARFHLAEIAALGGPALLLVIALMTLALIVASQLGRWLGVDRRLSDLIAVGTAVCGNSAIAATAPVIGARDEDVSFAVATNTLLGTLAVFAYPLIGRALGFDPVLFGVWAGAAVNDTSQVVATGFAYGPEAGETAVTVKLVRNALMGAVIVFMGVRYRQQTAGDTARAGGWWTQARRALPPFVIGFLALATLRTLGAFDVASATVGVDLADLCARASKAMILVALAGVGLGTRAAVMRRTGPRPFYLGLATALATSLTCLALLQLIGPKLF
ncbi:MAG: putative sulfate exporter family transporter [Acidobacteriota bacterium]